MSANKETVRVGSVVTGPTLPEPIEVLATVPGVRGVEAGPPADGWTRKQWDLCILVQFADLGAVEAYRTDPTHRAFADVFLKPLRDKIRVWNFELADPE